MVDMRTSLALACGLSLILGLSACGPDAGPTTPAAAPASSARTAGGTGTSGGGSGIEGGVVAIDLVLTGGLNETIKKTAGTCSYDEQSAYFAFTSKEVGAKSDFDLRVDLGSMPTLAVHAGGDSYTALKAGSKGTFAPALPKITFDVDAPNFSGGKLHVKGTMTCQK